MVTFLGFLQRLTGHREASVEVQSEMTILDLLNALASRYGEDFSSALFRAPGEVQTYLRIFVDEEEATPTDRIPFQSDTTSRIELIILPIFEGGSQ